MRKFKKTISSLLRMITSQLKTHVTKCSITKAQCPEQSNKIKIINNTTKIKTGEIIPPPIVCLVSNSGAKSSPRLPSTIRKGSL